MLWPFGLDLFWRCFYYHLKHKHKHAYTVLAWEYFPFLDLEWFWVIWWMTIKLIITKSYENIFFCSLVLFFQVVESIDNMKNCRKLSFLLATCNVLLEIRSNLTHYRFCSTNRHFFFILLAKKNVKSLNFRKTIRQIYFAKKNCSWLRLAFKKKEY